MIRMKERKNVTEGGRVRGNVKECEIKCVGMCVCVCACVCLYMCECMYV